MNYQEIEQQTTPPLYPKRDVTIVRGEGARLFDDQGREFLDCTAGIGVANVGHCHPKVVEAIQRQSETLITCANVFYNDQRSKLLDALLGLTPDPLTRAFLCNSGAEAIEASLKFSCLLYTSDAADE